MLKIHNINLSNEVKLSIHFAYALSNISLDNLNLYTPKTLTKNILYRALNMNKYRNKMHSTVQLLRDD